MTPKIALIIGIAVTALAFGVPTAFGERQPDGVAYFYANERATVGFRPVIHDHGDATQAKLVAQSAPIEVIHDHGDATQAKLVAQSAPIEVIHDHGDATQAKLVAQSAPIEVIHDHGDATQAKLVAQSVDAVKYLYANERATVGFRPVIHDHGDATQAKLVAQSAPIEVIHDHGDATQAKLVAQSVDAVKYLYANERATVAEQGSSGVGSRDQVRLDPNSLSPTVTASSGSEIEWPQLGIGFGLGILLVAGLWLAMRMTKGRPLAH